MNITLSIDEKTVTQARRVAAAQKKSLNQFIRDHLQNVTQKPDIKNSMKELRRLSLKNAARKKSWRFNRAELYDRGA